MKGICPYFSQIESLILHFLFNKFDEFLMLILLCHLTDYLKTTFKINNKCFSSRKKVFVGTEVLYLI